MTPPDPSTVLDGDGPGAPPRRNGELVFAAPWESRLFGLTMALHRAGLFEWDEFRRLLIDEIHIWERGHAPGDAWSYYERWHAAFERLLASKGLCATDELAQRAAALSSRAPGHDHYAAEGLWSAVACHRFGVGGALRWTIIRCLN
jgi:nitrile hydratase accessory protein